MLEMFCSLVCFHFELSDEARKDYRVFRRQFSGLCAIGHSILPMKYKITCDNVKANVTTWAMPTCTMYIVYDMAEGECDVVWI